MHVGSESCGQSHSKFEGIEFILARLFGPKPTPPKKVLIESMDLKFLFNFKCFSIITAPYETEAIDAPMPNV